MGYTLRIGEAELNWSEDCVDITCQTVRRDDAPAHGDPTDYTSERWPSYSAWFESMRQLGLMDVMFDLRNGGAGEVEVDGEYIYPLIQTHPGAASITKRHVQYVEAKIAEYKRLHPDHVARYPPPKAGAEPIPGTGIYREEDEDPDPRNDPWLCRGEWLLYWLKWAVENCEKPVFINS